MPTEVNRTVEWQESYYLDAIRSVAVTSDNEFIISGAWDGTIKVFYLSTKELFHDFGRVHYSRFVEWIGRVLLFRRDSLAGCDVRQ